MKVLYLEGGRLYFLDQTLLPHEERYVEIKSADELVDAIKALKVRGAPLIGIAAAYGVYIEALRLKGREDWRSRVLEAIERLWNARPTAYNLMRALERSKKILLEDGTPEDLLKEAQRIEEEERESCERMGEYGASLVSSPVSVLTICNTGTLATGGIGTALGVIRKIKEKGLLKRVFVMETRPLLQGARLTMWELKKDGIEGILINDSVAPFLIKRGEVDIIFTGADRIAMNGDVANKVGTLSLAIAAKRYGVSLYVVAPLSTFDPHAETGEQIVVEKRSGDEVVSIFGVRIAPLGTKALNYAFDVTERELIKGYITERGLIEPPFHPYFPIQK